MPAEPIRALIVDDDPVVAHAHSIFVRKVPGFTVSGTAHSGAEALRQVSCAPHDLILLDLSLPDVAGLEVCRILRSRKVRLDIMAITSARDLESVQNAVSFGVVQYLLKPFGFSTFQRHLERYAAFRQQLTAPSAAPIGQRDVDFALATLRPDAETYLEQPKGLSDATLDAVVAQLRTAQEPKSADDIAGALGLSRVTARRYLQRLTAQRLAAQTQRYGRSGRPGHLYRWCGA
jgi:response regulator of citrate/malate metabolism